MHILYKQNNIVLGLLITTSGADARIQGKVHMLGNTTLVILNIKSFIYYKFSEHLRILQYLWLEPFTKKAQEKRDEFLSMFFGKLVDSLLYLPG